MSTNHRARVCELCAQRFTADETVATAAGLEWHAYCLPTAAAMVGARGAEGLVELAHLLSAGYALRDLEPWFGACSHCGASVDDAHDWGGGCASCRRALAMSGGAA